jgi:LPXTG-site transpeptidase (sortase) family protein
LSYGHHGAQGHSASRRTVEVYHTFFFISPFIQGRERAMIRSVYISSGGNMRRIILFPTLIMAVLLAAVTVGSATASPKPKSPSLVPAGWPKAMSIPSMHVVKAPVEPNALNSARDIDAPFKWGDVAWFSRGPRPGDQGRASIYGHLDSYTGPAVFYQLKNLKKGDKVYVVYKNGRTLTFQVKWSKSYPNNKLPMGFLYGSTKERGMALITCGGLFHRDGTGYDHKLVVYTTLVMPTKK